MTEEFHFKDSVDMNAIVKQIGESMAATVGGNPQSTKCKGIRIYFVDEETELLMSHGMFVKGFSPEDWDDDQ